MGKRPLLTEQEIDDQLESLSGWKVEEGKWIVKTYLLTSFLEAIAFVNRVAELSEELNHHPFISIDYRRVTLRLTTWHSGGLTELDIDSAIAYDK
jgi:4a-hydroxytetrahydrobiopterin dehydratase